jgi:methyltransferase
VKLHLLTAFELLVLLAVLQRLLELLRSRANQRTLSEASRSADSRANWIALVLLQALWLGGAALEPFLRGGVAPAPLYWTGLGLFLAGEGLRLWCMRSLGTWWNVRARVDPRLRVVSTGPYRWIRHPNYLGVLLELCGLPLAGGAWITLLLLAPAHALVLRRRMRGEDELLFALPGYAQAMGGKGALWPRTSLLRRRP